MAHPTRQEVLSILQNDWAEYVQRFRRLPSESQDTFLIKQGYARFADLLSHIVAWWQAGCQSIERYVVDPTAPLREYDVDIFNAEAVAKVAGLAEDRVIGSFEEMRQVLIEFVNGLPDTVFEDERVVNQLRMDVIGHFGEHKISERE